MSVRLGALEPPAWIPRRLGAAAAALALNAGLGTALILCFRIPIASDSREAVAALMWIAEPASRLKRAEPRESRASDVRPSEQASSAVAPSVAPTSVPRAPVDWWKEGERVVKERTRVAPALPDSGRTDLHIESLGDAPVHYAGESSRDESGAKIVWVSDKCYIESDPPILGRPPGLEGGTVTRTVCPGDSNVARGDLFEHLPAYRKFHPK